MMMRFGRLTRGILVMTLMLSLCAAPVIACAGSNDEAMILFCEENFASIEAPGSFTIDKVGPLFSEGLMAMMPEETVEQYKDAVSVTLNFTDSALQKSKELTEKLFPGAFVLSAGKDDSRVPNSASLVTNTPASGEASYAVSVIFNRADAAEYVVVGFAGMSDADVGEIPSQCYLVCLGEGNEGEVLGGPYTIPEN